MYKLLNEKDAGNLASCSSESAHLIKRKNCKKKGDWNRRRRGAAALSEPIDRVKDDFLEINEEFTFCPFQDKTKFCVHNYSIIQSHCTPPKISHGAVYRIPVVKRKSGCLPLLGRKDELWGVQW
jgi:hypothetical protein